MGLRPLKPPLKGMILLRIPILQRNALQGKILYRAVMPGAASLKGSHDKLKGNFNHGKAD